MPTELRTCIVETPIGGAVVAFSADGVAAMKFGDAHAVAERLAREHGAACEPDASLLPTAAAALDTYFDGARRTIDLPIDWSLTSGFSREALRAVCDIPYGETASYGEVAAMTARPRAARAVGTACRTTPLALIVPVHRVIRADGSLGEFGGNEHVKEYLVDFERGNVAQAIGIEEEAR
ncbi:methylated-DNA--[protein]-cysteine S-methyltransferase [Microbacterium halophytorum]|uniref:methylated-DNA--[protein]-cysteine S-methyltransferase n=1 Tax=Microbacterium halophytorum TaxID=2067568 RepID=UPI000CFA8A2A|nr:methylated-DNA--[protein]-cysteine S-methyltransferase [Microbacterium halophytorum]